MSRIPNLNAYLVFEAVARRGTVTRAAEELSVSPSAVSQQVKLLEQQLGIRLFRRDGKALSLTLEGEQMFHACATAIRLIRDARQSLGKQHETLRLSFRVTPGFGVRWLGPRLADFATRHPTWHLRVDAAPDPTDFEREIMDFDIRYGAVPWDGFHCAPVIPDMLLPLCSPALRDQLAPAGDARARLDAAPLIDSARALGQWDAWLHHFGLEIGSNTKSILLDRSSLALQMAVDGAGVVLESLALAAREVAEGRLVPLTPELPVLEYPAYWLVCPARNLSRRGVRRFIDWLDVQALEHRREVSEICTQHGLRVERLVSVEALVGGFPPP